MHWFPPQERGPRARGTTDRRAALRLPRSAHAAADRAGGRRAVVASRRWVAPASRAPHSERSFSARDRARDAPRRADATAAPRPSPVDALDRERARDRPATLRRRLHRRLPARPARSLDERRRGGARGHAAARRSAAGWRRAAGRISSRSRLGPLRRIALATAVLVSLTGVLAGAPLALLVPLLVAAGVLAMSWNSLSFAAAVELAGHERSGIAIGLQQTLLNLPARVYPALFGLLVATTSWEVAFVAVAALPARRLARAATIAGMIVERLDAIYAIARHRPALLAGGGRRARARRRVDARGRARGRRATRPGTSSAAAATHASGPARISTACRRPGASTARSASSPAIEAAARLPDAPLAVVAFRARGDRPDGLAPPRRAPADASSRCTSSRGRCSSGSASRSASSRRSPARPAGSGCSRGAPTTPARRRWTRAPTRSSRRPASSSTSATAPARERWRRSARSRWSRTRRTSCPRASTVSVDARSADAALLDTLIADIGFDVAWRSDPGADGRRLRGRAPGSAAPRLRCRARRDGGRRTRRCSSSAR